MGHWTIWHWCAAVKHQTKKTLAATFLYYASLLNSVIIALLEDFYSNVVRTMESVLGTLGGVQDGMAAVVSEPEDIPRNSNEPVWILGKKYNAIQGKLLYSCVCFVHIFF